MIPEYGVTPIYTLLSHYNRPKYDIVTLQVALPAI